MHDCILIHLLCSDGRRPGTDLPASPGSAPRCTASGATGDRERAGRYPISARADVRHDLQRRMSTWVSPIHSPSSSSVSCPSAGESVTSAFFRRGGRRGEVLIDGGGNGATTGMLGRAGAGVAHNHDADPGGHASTKERTPPPSSRLPWRCGAPPAIGQHVQGSAGRQTLVPISYMRLFTWRRVPCARLAHPLIRVRRLIYPVSRLASKRRAPCRRSGRRARGASIASPGTADKRALRGHTVACSCRGVRTAPKARGAAHEPHPTPRPAQEQRRG